MNKFLFFLVSLNLILLTCRGQEPKLQGDYKKELFAGPDDTLTHNDWVVSMKKWRTAKKNELHYTGREYQRKEFSWLKKTFIYVQVMAHDRYLYDPKSGNYTVDLYLDDLKKRYGGIDAVLIWVTYPNMGIDSRNQFDLLHDMPGGIPGVKKMVEDFHRRGVRVFFPIMIWDKGTRKIDQSMAGALVREMQEVGADGLNGDTMYGITKDFFDAYDSLNYPLVLQPEAAFTDMKMIEWNTSSWGYYWPYKYSPGVTIYKWLEPSHQVFVTNRWAVNKTDDLQYAFFNGIGYNAWENIWGIWNQVPERYGETIRRIATIYRHFPGIWSSPDWEPHIPVLQRGIFASKFPAAGKTIYNFINRDSILHSGKQIALAYKRGMRYFDLWNGKELMPQKEGKLVYLSFPIEGFGYGSVLAVKEISLKDSFYLFLNEMSGLSEKPLMSLSAEWKYLPQKIIPIGKTQGLSGTRPKDMVLIPEGKDYKFISKGTMIEGDALPLAVGVQYPWEGHPSRSTERAMNIPSFFIDKYPVTNRQFKQFLDDSHYHPEEDHHFLKDWKDGTFPDGWGNKPVTWVSIEDARAYAAWAGKRLPHEWEWQYAAQGPDGRQYPWGNDWDSARVAVQDAGNDMRPPTDVDAFPEGASPFGVMDMVGNVWNWTDEYEDEHTRSAVLKGGSYYRPSTSGWYFRKACELNKYGKYLLFYPGLDRSGSIGFRCVKDL